MPCLAWGGFLNSQHLINTLFRSTVDYLIAYKVPPPHCLSHLLPPQNHHSGLRPRGHNHSLPILLLLLLLLSKFIKRNIA